MNIDINGKTMIATPEQIAELKELQEQIPDPEPTVSDIFTEVKALRTENAQLQQQVDALTEGRTS